MASARLAHIVLWDDENAITRSETMGCRRNLRPPSSELHWPEIENINHIVSFLRLSLFLPSGQQISLFLV